MTGVRRAALALALCGGAAAGLRAADWPQFRGPQRDNIAREAGLARSWPDGGPKVVWSTPVCEGYAGAAISGGRVYFEDYGRKEKEYWVRCLELTDGREVWRFREAKTIRPNHGITRAVVATDGERVFALDPKCILHVLSAADGREVWRKDLVEQYKSQIPAWYNGQCPLLDGERLVIGVGGENALLVALDHRTGTELWRSPNPDNWPLSHASVMPATLGGVKQYLWCTLFGLVGVRAEDGRELWRHARKFNVAVAPSPLPIAPDRVFMTSCYDAGTLMIAVRGTGDAFQAETLFDWPGTQWNSEVHTPVLWQGHLYAVGKEKRGLLTCLDLGGQQVWTSAGKATFDLGSFLVVVPPEGSAGPAAPLMFIVDGKTGLLRLVELNAGEYRELGAAQVLNGDNVWAPLALSGTKLIVRDMEKMVCLEVGGG